MALVHDCHRARQDLKLERIHVVHPGAKSYPLNEWSEAVAIADLNDKVDGLK